MGKLDNYDIMIEFADCVVQSVDDIKMEIKRKKEKGKNKNVGWIL